jgi:hypothetical protein
MFIGKLLKELSEKKENGDPPPSSTPFSQFTPQGGLF